MRLNDNEKVWGPFCFATTSGWKPIRFVFSTGDDERRHNTITLYLGRFIFQVQAKQRIKPWCKKTIATSWDEATIKRLGRNYYEEFFPKEYGFSYHNGFLQIFYGRQTWDSDTTDSWCTHLPWTQRRLSYENIVNPITNQIVYEAKNPMWGPAYRTFDEFYAAKQACPKQIFIIEDYDGEHIEAKVHIRNRWYDLGEKWCKWLSLFSPTKKYTTLEIEFSSEVGPEKGSWKGGTMGTGIDMLPNETVEQAMERWCNLQHNSKYQTYKVKLVK